MKKPLFSLIAVLSLTGPLFADQVPDHKVLVLKTRDGSAVQGYDPIAYFTDRKAVKGNVSKADENWPGLVVRNGSGGKTLVFTDRKGVALEGYDPISYFTDGKPIRGDAKIEATFNGALYHFVSQEHREVFEKDPIK